MTISTIFRVRVIDKTYYTAITFIIVKITQKEFLPLFIESLAQIVLQLQTQISNQQTLLTESNAIV